MEAGAASELVALADSGAVNLAPEQRLMTPYQRMVILLETKRQHEKAQEESGQPRMNSARHPSGGTMGGETVTYVNKNA